MFGGRVIPRFAVFTRENGHFSFSARNNHRLLRAVRDHIGGEKIVRSATFFGVMRAGFSGLWRRLTPARVGAAAAGPVQVLVPVLVRVFGDVCVAPRTEPPIPAHGAHISP